MLDSLPRHREAEVVQSVGGIEDDATLLRRPYLRVDLSMRQDDPTRLPGHEVAEDIAPLHQFYCRPGEIIHDVVGDTVPRLTDVQHKR